MTIGRQENDLRVFILALCVPLGGNHRKNAGAAPLKLGREAHSGQLAGCEPIWTRVVLMDLCVAMVMFQ